MDTSEGNAVLEEFLQDAESSGDEDGSNDNPMNMSVDNGGGNTGLDVDTIMNMMSVPPNASQQRQRETISTPSSSGFRAKNIVGSFF